MGPTKVTNVQRVDGRVCPCVGCGQSLRLNAFSRNQLSKASPKCRDCVDATLRAAAEQPGEVARTKRCVQCFRDLAKDAFSKRQYHSLDGKCMDCVDELESAASATHAASRWSYDCYYRVCHKGKAGGVAVRVKCNIASPIAGHLPLGRVFRATGVVYNEQGDPMVKLALESFACLVGADTEASDGKHRDGWVPCRSIRNEVLVELHRGPFQSETAGIFYRCVIEGCKVRVRPELELPEIGYVLYGDVVEVVETVINRDGVVFLRLHSRYFDEPTWAVERTLDNESVLNEVDGPNTEQEQYRCVQESGAPVRLEPSLSAPPVGRVSCGMTVTVVERVVTSERQIFLRLNSSSARSVLPNVTPADGKTQDVWVIETSTCCASVMVKIEPFDIQRRCVIR